MFTLSLDGLKALWQANLFEVPDSGLLFFGFRGCLPATPDHGHIFQKTHNLTITDVNYQNPRCTLGQANFDDETFAIFSASTVPSFKNIKKAKQRGGKGTNQLMTGFHPGYTQGWHSGSSPRGHRAFRMEGKLPIRRTADDLDYDELDRVEYMAPYDNIHSAWSMGPEDSFSSAGCQVVVGYPKCKQRHNRPNTGPWANFYDNAYSHHQNKFDYILLNGRDALSASAKKPASRIRYGSRGDLVRVLQEKLTEQSFYQGHIDSQFGQQTLFALLDFQQAEFGKNAADGIVGPITASALGITLNHS
ncbi:peptidoglycan-binding protein [Photobacterium sp. OFAV2-7]|uniref:peptidoglycan-binding domain-containing protein n=1 Tax=Photobacterium sp. OFAV2-7 TaxID=2917748 RepID=UPI001EF3D9B1|nr:peptidoglycan-binding domain-containing protein [Photobacterium sp. OFAV2-7]MCG7585181.1 peptidoglycan-binding protein [Photobacterium sp. OFAV2-7]